MPRWGAKNTAVVLLLVVALVASLTELGAASFTEFFAPSDDPNSQALMPGLWSQVGVVSMGDGRGTVKATKAAMKLTVDDPTAETVLLGWDGTKDTLDFWYYLTNSCENGHLKITMSCNTKDWFTVWSKKLLDMQIDSYNIERVQLPLNTSCPTFAVRWDFKLGNCFSLTAVYIDEITFPAKGLAADGADLPPALQHPDPVATPPAQITAADGPPTAAAANSDSSPGSNNDSGQGAVAIVKTGDPTQIFNIKNTVPVPVPDKSDVDGVHVVVGWWLLPVLCMCMW